MQYNSTAYFEILKEIIIQYLSKNYDYCYLSAMHEKNRREGVETIIVGSSHAMNGLLERRMEEGGWGRTINFSISSQDIWFDYLHVKKALEEGRSKVRYCIICFGYYMLYHDLSQSTLMSFLLPKVYAPLFGREYMHHMDVEKASDPLEILSYDREMFPDNVVSPVCEHWAEKVLLEQSSYYGGLVHREEHEIPGLKKTGWIGRSEEEKHQIASERAADHNKLKKYTSSREENGRLLSEMIGYLVQHGVRPLVLITPYTKYYNQYIDPAYREDIYQLLESIPWPLEFFDM
ncbi:MAG: hypothetical protein IJP92_09460, partial [Lachnospiraceae bacterium]|nr:hypothetical protein [Lachnospiraceae bacterium]